MRRKITALIPLRDGHIISFNTLRSYLLKTVKLDIKCISRPLGKGSSDLKCSANACETIIHNYNILREEALSATDDIFLFLHRDVCFSSSGVVK